MVYRVQRAKKSLFVRIFIVVVIYSLIIGASGLLILGFVINFDQQSFNPTLENAGSNNFLVCDGYGSTSCPWLLYNDLIAQNQSIPYFSYYSSMLTNLKSNDLSHNLVLLKDNSTNSFVLGQVYFHEDGLFVGTSDYLSRVSNPNNFIPDYQVNLGYYCGSSSNNCTLSFANGLGPQSVFTFTNNNSVFYGTKVLLSGSPSEITNSTNIQSLLICSNMLQCPYNKVANYQYINGQQQTKAFEAVIYGDLSSSDKIVCIYDNNSCNILQSNTTEFIINSNSNLISGYYYVKQLSPSSNDIVTNTINSNPSSSCKIAGGNPELIQLYCDNSQNPLTFNIISDPLALSKSPVNINVPVFKLDESHLYIKIVFMKRSTVGKSTPAVLLNVISQPSNVVNSLTTSLPKDFFIASIIFFVVNFILTFILIEFGFWKKIGSWLSPKIISLFRGKVGTALELTQFFDFGGEWYLELHGVYDYNFTSTRGVINELLRQRWRDTIFFPTALAASISILLITWVGGTASVLMLIVIAGLLPFFLAFWVPILWVIEDAGLKRVDYNDRGELLTIQKIAFIVRDGFNKLVGFGAIFGVGTAGASIARAEILQQNNITLASAFAGGWENLLNLNFNFLVSAILWTIALLLLTTAVSLTGNILLSLNYLNTGHLNNVKKFRNQLVDKEIYMGTTQQVMDYAKREESLYYDSAVDSAEEMVKDIPNSSQITPDTTDLSQKESSINSSEELKSDSEIKGDSSNENNPSSESQSQDGNESVENDRSIESQGENADRDFDSK